MEEFLRIDANRVELFTCLAVHLTHLETEKQVVTTNGADALSNHPLDFSSIAQCNHEEADSWMILHLQDAVNVGYKKVILWTVGRHRCGCLGRGSNSGALGGFWDTLGTSPRRRLLHPLALTSLDLFPYFMLIRGVIRGTWKVFEDATPTFLALSSGPGTSPFCCMTEPATLPT